MADNLRIVDRGSLPYTEQAILEVADRLEEAFRPRSNYGSAHGKLTVGLNLRGLAGRMTLECWVKSSGAADFYLEGSTDGKNWRPIATLSLSGAGETHDGYLNAYPVVRVWTAADNDNEAELCSSR